MQTFVLPATYWTDYTERFDHPGEWRSRGRNQVVVSLDDKQLEALLGDARHYADPDATDCPAWLRRSAARTLEIIRTNMTLSTCT